MGSVPKLIPDGWWGGKRSHQGGKRGELGDNVGFPPSLQQPLTFRRATALEAFLVSMRKVRMIWEGTKEPRDGGGGGGKTDAPLPHTGEIWCFQKA